jgi:two-component system NarL family sensor kinase
MNEILLSDEDQIVNIILIAIGLLTLMSLAIVAFFYFSRKRIIKTELEKATMEIAHQKDVLQSTIITQEEERKRIAQDLHDAISSKLNIVSLNANFLKEDAITNEETRKIGESILKITTTVLQSSRRIAHDLLPPTLDKFGFAAAMEELLDEINETKRFVVGFTVDYNEAFLNPTKELHLFRIVQELLNNSIKHSEAKNINLNIFTKENKLYLQYSDDGKGFDYALKRTAKGLGMSGIENRVQILNGEINFETSPGKGILVTIEIVDEYKN